MADEEPYNRHQRVIDSPSSPPFGMSHQSALEENGGCGEIVEVQGGHIVRSTGRKDRHSKVCTAKGPRDRRLRLSAPTAIQFYDVQDRLGFDRPSKAVDWLITKAKSAIDDLAELPPWNPVDTAANVKPRRTKTLISPPASVGASVSGETEYHHARNGNESSFLPSAMDSDSIADTIKTFFPVVASTEASPQLIQQNYNQPANTQNQDLRLSLQSFQNGPPFTHQTEPILFSGQSNPLGFDSSTISLNNGGAVGTGGLVFAYPSSFQAQNQLCSQRGPLQSINTPTIHAWFDPHHHHHHHYHSTTTDNHHPYHIPPESGELPTRFQGVQEEHGDNKPSSDSRH